MQELKLYTVADIREWLVNNKPAKGLSGQVIDPTRAWAIIHNPYVKDDDAVVAAIFEDGVLAAYTASFPDMVEGKRVWWASTLYCYPQFAGRGYGMIVAGSLMEAHKSELTYDRWGAPETIEIFNHFDYKTTYNPRYHISFKKIDTSSLKGKLAYCVHRMKQCFHPWPKQSDANYTLRYASYIDGEAYAFMKLHCEKDLWLRKQEMLNWILRYPLRQGCTLLDRTEVDIAKFRASTTSYGYNVAKVYVDDAIVGLYVMRQNSDTFAIVYLYYDESYRNDVFLSITDHIIRLKPHVITMENDMLCVFMQKQFYFYRMSVERVSFSLPEEVRILETYTLQLGDGDSFI